MGSWIKLPLKIIVGSRHFIVSLGPLPLPWLKKLDDFDQNLREGEATSPTKDIFWIKLHDCLRLDRLACLAHSVWISTQRTNFLDFLYSFKGSFQKSSNGGRHETKAEDRAPNIIGRSSLRSRNTLAQPSLPDHTQNHPVLCLIKGGIRGTCQGCAICLIRSSPGCYPYLEAITTSPGRRAAVPPCPREKPHE